MRPGGDGCDQFHRDTEHVALPSQPYVHTTSDWQPFQEWGRQSLHYGEWKLLLLGPLRTSVQRQLLHRGLHSTTAPVLLQIFDLMLACKARSRVLQQQAKT
ncbi:unnamed protein product [Symbiodinium sp. CCMP2592]|nr:unnamed protein product [Symbiodinium sp. CCMP2592]